jgi:hypothetical protein
MRSAKQRGAAVNTYVAAGLVWVVNSAGAVATMASSIGSWLWSPDGRLGIIWKARSSANQVNATKPRKK